MCFSNWVNTLGMLKFYIKVMDFRNTNIAVIKSMMLQMKKEKFIETSKEVKSEILNLEVNLKNANYRFAMINLLKWCYAIYEKNYICYR